MASEFYKDSLITSSPKRDAEAGKWVPYAFVSWHEYGKLKTHRFAELGALSFGSEMEAVTCGLLEGHKWVDSRG
jgi:hypothetical protein